MSSTLRLSIRAMLAITFLIVPAFAGLADTGGRRLDGGLGIQESTTSIQQRQAVSGPRAPRPEHEVRYPDRSGLPQAPGAPAVSSFPAARPGSSGPSPNIHTTGLAFDGPTLADTGAFPPDTMGAVGPTQFISFLNGRIRSFTKAGAADGVLNFDPDVFFASVMTPVSPPQINFTSDPQVRYDRFTARWFLTIIDVPCTDGTCATTLANRVLIAVSDAASAGTISGTTVWTFFQFTGDPGTNFLDYPSLGIDVNALYIGGNMFNNAGTTFLGTNGYVVQKASVLGAGPIVVTMFANLVSGVAGEPDHSPHEAWTTWTRPRRRGTSSASTTPRSPR